MSLQYIGLDVHKKLIFYCIKDAAGETLGKGKMIATREEVEKWCRERNAEWNGLMEATMFSGWIYDAMRPFAKELNVGHPALMKHLLPGKNKSDPKDASRFADLCRCNAIPKLEVMETELRYLRSQLRLRNLFKRQTVQVKNRIASLMMEAGLPYDPRKLHTKRYYEGLLSGPALPAAIKPMLRMCRSRLEAGAEAQKSVVSSLQKNPRIAERVKRLRSIPGVGLMMALTWVLEIGNVNRFPSADHAMSYCGLVSAENTSAGKNKGGPLSKKRNRWLQTMLIEVAHLAPRYNWRLEQVRLKCGKHPNVAAVEVARKLVTYLMAVDRSGKEFQMPPQPEQPATAAETVATAAASQPQTAPKASARQSAKHNAGASGAGGKAPATPTAGGIGVAERSSPSRVRCAATRGSAPLTAAGRSAPEA